MKHMGLTVDSDPAYTVQTGHKGISAGGVGADLLVLVKGKQGDADGVVLRQGLADDLALLVLHLVLQGQDLRFGNVSHGSAHW